MLKTEGFKERKEEFLSLVANLKGILEIIPFENWGNSTEILNASRKIQEFYHQFGLGVHIGISRGPKLTFITYPMNKVDSPYYVM